MSHDETFTFDLNQNIYPTKQHTWDFETIVNENTRQSDNTRNSCGMIFLHVSCGPSSAQIFSLDRYFCDKS